MDLNSKSTQKTQVWSRFFSRIFSRKVNPGDKVHTIDKINKVVSGQNRAVEKELIKIYSNLTKGKVFGKEH